MQMTLENKWGLTSSAGVTREEERISKKKVADFLKKVFYATSLPAKFQSYRHSINISLMAFTTSQANSEPSILQKTISVLRL